MQKNKLRILFYLAKPYSIPITNTLRELVNNSSDYISLTITSKRLVSSFTEENVTDDIKTAEKFKPDIVFCPGNYVHHSIGGIKVQLFHGLGFEKRGHFNIRGFFQIYCTPGPLLTNRFRELAKKHKSFIVFETGWAKIDLLYKKNTDEILKKIPIDKKIILYAPTFSKKLTSVPKVMKFIKSLPKKNEFFLIKLHDLHNKKEKDFFKTLPKDKFMFIKEPDITPFLKISDILISDTSSVVYEFAIINPRIILIEPKRKDLPFISIHPNKLRSAIDNLLKNKNNNFKEVKELVNNIHPYKDSKNALRVLKKVTDPAVMEQARNLPIKSNWFRKLKLRYYDIFKKGYIK